MGITTDAPWGHANRMPVTIPWGTSKGEHLGWSSWSGMDAFALQRRNERATARGGWTSPLAQPIREATLRPKPFQHPENGTCTARAPSTVTRLLRGGSGCAPDCQHGPLHHPQQPPAQLPQPAPRPAQQQLRGRAECTQQRHQVHRCVGIGVPHRCCPFGAVRGFVRGLWVRSGA